MTILTLDPSGHSETGAFWFENFDKWELFTITGKNSREQGKNLKKWLKNKKPDCLAWETSYWVNTKKLQKYLQELIYFNGIIGFLVQDLGIKEECQVLNLEVQKVLNYQLERVKKLQLIKSQWFFSNRKITVHERDALLVFYVYWVVKQKRTWPWA
jgi:hypothetical protein